MRVVPEPTAVLECLGVTAGYSGPEGTRCIVENATFAVGEGELLVLLGRSGSGKSTLLRLLNRFTEPLAGTVRYRGKPLVEWDPLLLRQRVALVLQTPVVFEGTVRENLLARPDAQPASEEALGRALTEVDLDSSLLDLPAADLSVGEQQRVCIARALFGQPDVLLLDEPTAALDPHTASRIADLVRALRASRNLTTVVVTHDPGLVRRLDGRVALLVDRTIEASPSAEAVEGFLAGD
jgi:putative ABC transport system ATP-binding protein